MTADLARTIKARWKVRKLKSHKGSFGRVFILAGSENFPGAPHLTAAGALYSGAGLVTLGVPRNIYAIAASREAEVMVRPFPAGARGSLSAKSLKSILEFEKTQDVLAIGPGLSTVPETQKLIRDIISRTSKPLVIDADGLNALAGKTEVLKATKGRAVLTPHPGEFSRLFPGEPSGTDIERMRCAREAAVSHNVTLVLKGWHSVVASWNGKTTLNPTGNPGMATGGSGDVLTGVVAALMAQGFSCEEAAIFGVYFHGLAGDLAAKETGQIGLTALAIARHLPAAFKKVLGW